MIMSVHFMKLRLQVGIGVLGHFIRLHSLSNGYTEDDLKKLPKVKELSAEYAEILAEKKKLYGEYRQVKKDMQEIQRAKYDIDQFLKSDEEQKKERVRKHNITR